MKQKIISLLALVSLGITGLFVVPNPIYAQSEVYVQNFTADEVGDYGAFNHVDTTFRHDPSDNKNLRVVLDIPTETNDGRKITSVKGIRFKIQDHDEGGKFKVTGIRTAEESGSFYERTLSGGNDSREDVDTFGIDENCGRRGGFLDIRHWHHTDSPDRCMKYHPVAPWYSTEGDSNVKLTNTENKRLTSHGSSLFYKVDQQYDQIWIDLRGFDSCDETCQKDYKFLNRHYHIGDIEWLVDAEGDPPSRHQLELTSQCIKPEFPNQTDNKMFAKWTNASNQNMTLKLTTENADTWWVGGNGFWWQKTNINSSSYSIKSADMQRAGTNNSFSIVPGTTYFGTVYDPVSNEHSEPIASVTPEWCGDCDPTIESCNAKTACQINFNTVEVPEASVDSLNYRLDYTDFSPETFQRSEVFISYVYNGSTDDIYQYLGTSTYESQAPTTGQWFGYRIADLSSNDITIQDDGSYRYTGTLDESTPIGGNQRSIGELIDFINQQNAAVIAENEQRRENGQLPLPLPVRDYLSVGVNFNDSNQGFNNGLCQTVYPINGGGPTESCVNQAAAADLLEPDETANTINIVNGKFIVKWQANQLDPNWSQVDEYRVYVFDASKLSDQNYQLANLVNATSLPGDVGYFRTRNISPNRTDPYQAEFSAPTMDGEIYVAVVSIDDECAQVNPDWVWTASDVTVTPTEELSGLFYLYDETANTVEQISVDVEAIAVSPEDHKYPGNISILSGNTGYRIPTIGDNSGGTDYFIALKENNPEYGCANYNSEQTTGEYAGYCVKTVTPNHPDRNKNPHFYFISQDPVEPNKPWWQVWGGLVFSNNSMNSNLPENPAEPGDKLYLIDRLVDSIPQTAGVALTVANNFAEQVRGWITNGQPQLAATTVWQSNSPSVEDFIYFSGKIGPVSPAITESTINNEGELAGTTEDGVSLHYKNGDLKFAPDNEAWTVSGKHIILVDGNVTISAENLDDGNDVVINTPEGNFVAFIASGNIIFNGTVGNSEPTIAQPNVEGVFIGDQIIVQNSSKRFVGEGSFIGLNNVQLNRTYTDSADGTTPAELFIHRPDFAIHAPAQLRSVNLNWQEVN